MPRTAAQGGVVDDGLSALCRLSWMLTTGGAQPLVTTMPTFAFQGT